MDAYNDWVRSGTGSGQNKSLKLDTQKLRQISAEIQKSPYSAAKSIYSSVMNSIQVSKIQPSNDIIAA
jgi:hypothetical protein